MTSRIAVIALDCHDAEAQARFWCAVLGWRVLERDTGIVSIGGDASGPGMDLIEVPEPKTVKDRLHLDLRADGSSTADELARLEALGAVRVDVGQPADATWTVLADPEGHEFCLLGRTVAEATRPG